MQVLSRLNECILHCIRHGPFDILGGPGIFWKKISLL